MDKKEGVVVGEIYGSRDDGKRCRILEERIAALEERQSFTDVAIDELLCGEGPSLTGLADDVEKTNNLALINLMIFEELVKVGLIPEETLRLAAKCLVSKRIKMALKLNDEQTLLIAEMLPELKNEKGESRAKKTRSALKDHLKKIEKDQVFLAQKVRDFFETNRKERP